MKIVILGSNAQASIGTMDNFTTFFENKGCKVIFPSSSGALDTGMENYNNLDEKIKECDLVFLVNPEGHLDKTLIDGMNHATSFNKEIFALEKPKGGDFHQISDWLYN
ncbi:MAG: hypothetical protein ABIE74_00165 [Pseudomonadota bacterium]